MDTPKRSLTKALVWEGLGVITLFIVGLCMLSGNAVEIGYMTIIFYCIRILMFVAHEQIWERYIFWGRVRRPAKHEDRNIH